MGGKGSGGARLNSGPPRRVGSVRWLREQKKLRQQGQPAAAPAAVAVDTPDDLSAEQQRYWDVLSPHARAAGTLTPGTARAFRELCEWLAVKQAIYDDPKERGGTNYRGMAALVSQGLARFRLNADGKPMALPEAPKDEWAEFDKPHLVKRA